MSGVGAFACFTLSAVSYIPFIGAALWALPKVESAAAQKVDREQPHLAAGLLKIIKVPKLRSDLLTVLSTSILCSPLITFCPVLVSDVFHGGADQFSLAIGSFGIGGLLGALVLLAVSGQQDRSRLNSLFAIVYGLTVIACAFVPSSSELPVLMGVGGFSMAVGNTSVKTLL